MIVSITLSKEDLNSKNARLARLRSDNVVGVKHLQAGHEHPQLLVCHGIRNFYQKPYPVRLPGHQSVILGQGVTWQFGKLQRSSGGHTGSELEVDIFLMNLTRHVGKIK
eukprot:TRINITY_DN11463_c0_g1_i1.p1 TRINITY_DN11463_c0_g1~~TRINITY_DN11463_c0_g1_i1.p1  ORF type:complete len:109 (+),score=10.82 TRINITY_DN11463_c0_g1_i1:229-555(+)